MTPKISSDDVLAQAASWRDDGRPVALATVVATWGSSPRPVGSQLAIDQDGNMTGSVSGGCIEGAVVLFISDGLDRDNAEGLGAEIERLHKSCRRLIWLNPLLRYEGYEPRSLGAQVLVPHVDDFRTVHNLESLNQLTEVLSRPVTRRQEAASAWQEAV